MSELDTTEPSTDLRKQARERVEKKRDFKTHLFFYFLINAILVGIWAIVTPDALFWPIFPILGWGIGVAGNAWDVFVRKPITDAELLGRSDLHLGSCHLGAGASLAAVLDGRSVDTTMGFTPLEGLVMATRSGSVDPGLLLWLLERGRIDEREMADALEHESGLLGLAGAADIRDVLARADRGEADAALAIDVYVHRLRSSIAAMAASAGGLDALAFTGGVGENSARIRQLACEGLGFLGVALGEDANAARARDGLVESDRSSAAVLVIQSREDLEIAGQVRGLLA